MHRYKIRFPSEHHFKMFELGKEDYVLNHGNPEDESSFVYQLYYATVYVFNRMRDETSQEQSEALLTLWKRDFCDTCADGTTGVPIIH